MNWEERHVLVTGGASFISSHLVDKLVEFGAKVTVVDNLSNGKKENLNKSWDSIKFIQQSLEYISKKEIENINRELKEHRERWFNRFRTSNYDSMVKHLIKHKKIYRINISQS